MHDINPLGPMMHLKELDRQATPRLRRLRSRTHDRSSLTAASLSMLSYPRRLSAVRFLWRVARKPSY
jgi:hypothetical protein